MYARRSGDRVLTFDFAEGLIKNNLLVVDRETSSVWSQLHNQAISGPLKDTPMHILPAMQTTWKHWQTLHADTKVMFMEGKKGRPYYYFNFDPKAPRPRKRSKSHDTTALGLGLAMGGEAMFLAFRELDHAKTPMKMTLGGTALTIHYRKDDVTAWATDADGELVVGVLAYEKGWKDFHPETKTFTAGR